MNHKQLGKMLYKRIKVRPLARRFNTDGRELAALDDTWLIAEVHRDRIVVRNTRSDLVVSIGNDHIREFVSDLSGQSDGMLRLKSEIMIQGKAVSLEPLDDRGHPLRIKSANISLDDIDEALRLASGIVIEGPSPLSEEPAKPYGIIYVSPFVACFIRENIKVAYNGGSIAGLAPEITYYVFFNDPSRLGGPVTFLPTPVRHQALSQGNIYLGRIRISSRRK